jgi:CBS domain containing-hemolysin-like protein
MVRPHDEDQHGAGDMSRPTSVRKDPMFMPSQRRRAAALRALCAFASALLIAPSAHASFLSGDALAKAADVMAIVVIVIVPIVVIALFWMVHVLPEKIAHKRHHPQTEAIQVLCLLSLAFGGLLWPLAWLWAYSKPVLYKMAYGRDKADEYYQRLAAKAPELEASVRDDVARLRSDLDRLIARSNAPEELQAIRAQLAALEPRLPANAEEVR